MSGLEIIDTALAGGGDLVGQIGGLFRVGFEGAHHIHPVQGVEMIEVNDVVVQELSAQKQVADDAGVIGDGDAHGGVTGAHGGQPVNVGADPAGPLGEQIGIARVAALQHDLNPAEQHGAAPGITDLPVRDFHFYA